MNKCPHCKQDMPTVSKLLGQKIRAIRVRQQINQDFLAEVLGVSVMQISRLERGLNNISVEQLTDIAKALAVPYSVLMEDI